MFSVILSVALSSPATPPQAPPVAKPASPINHTPGASSCPSGSCGTPSARFVPAAPVYYVPVRSAPVATRGVFRGRTVERGGFFRGRLRGSCGVGGCG